MAEVTLGTTGITVNKNGFEPFLSSESAEKRRPIF